MATVYLVEDDAGVRQALTRALRAEGLDVESFDSAESYLAQADPANGGCLVLDISLPGLDGLELQRHLLDQHHSLPIIFLTGFGDIPMSVRAMKAGAADFLTKPVTSAALLDAVRGAMEADANHRKDRQLMADFERRHASLSAREREILAEVAKGRLNKQIAGDLGITERTVKFHRARIMARMQVRTVAELMHMIARLSRTD